jgi:predicted hydrolase (HD superfamily)
LAFTQGEISITTTLMHSLKHDNRKVFIQALHDAESLDHLHTYVQQKIIICTLLAASTLIQKLAKEAKLRVYDFPPKHNH